MNFSLSSLSNLSCTWWMLPKSLQNTLKKFTGKCTWKLSLYKNSDGTWGFDLPYLLTWNEKLMGGTDSNLDYWYTKLSSLNDEPSMPDTGSKLYLKCSSQPMEDYTTKLMFDTDDLLWPESSWYYDTKSGYMNWLCPYLQFLFGKKPEYLYLKLSLKK